RMIWGEGNPNAPLMIIIDNQGERKDKEGNEYVCRTRQTLQKAAHEVGLNEQDIDITYVLKRRPRKKYDKEQTRAICMGHVTQQLKEKQPALILCLGNVAVKSFFQYKEAEVKKLRGKVHHINGYRTLVAYHPLALPRRLNVRTGFIKDWLLVADQLSKQILS